jgi:hypothetical protein
MKTADFLSRIEETYPLAPQKGEAPDIAILRMSVITAINLHILLRTTDDRVTSAQVQHLIDAVQEIFTLTLCKIPEIYESYGDVIRPLDILKEMVRYSEPTPNEPAVQSIYVEPADPLHYHPHPQAVPHFGEVLEGAGEANHSKSA